MASSKKPPSGNQLFSGDLSSLDVDDLLVFEWAVAGAFFHAFECVDYILAVDYFTEDGVLHVQPRSRYSCDEELAAVGARACIGHRQKTRTVKGVTAHALIFEILAPDGFATAACASWVAALDHELFNNTVKDHTIIVAVFRVSAEILASFRSDIVEQFEFDAALCGFDN